MGRARALLWALLVVGIVLIVMPFAISLPSKASHGQTMIDQFHPLMQPASVRTTVDYYEQTFTPLGPVARGAVEAASELPAMLGALSHALHMPQARVQAFLGSFPALGGLIANLPRLAPVFARVPAGLAFYRPLVQTMKANVGNYASIDSLPNFRLFTWFFVIPRMSGSSWILE